MSVPRLPARGTLPGRPCGSRRRDSQRLERGERSLDAAAHRARDRRACERPRESLQLTRQVPDQFSEAVELGRIDIVPKVMINSGALGTAGSSAGSIFEAIFCLPLSDRLAQAQQPSTTPRDPRLESARDAIRDNPMTSLASNGTPR